MLSVRDSHFICVLWDCLSGRVESILDGRAAMKTQGVTLKQGIPQGIFPKGFSIIVTFSTRDGRKGDVFLSICNVAARVFLEILVGVMRLGSANLDPISVQNI